MPCRQHETLLRQHRRGNRQFVVDIVPLSSARFQLFVTFPTTPRIFPVNSANTSVLGGSRLLLTAGSAGTSHIADSDTLDRRRIRTPDLVVVLLGLIEINGSDRQVPVRVQDLEAA